MVIGFNASMTPRMAPGVRLKRDAIRQQWLILAPERIVEANDTAVAVLERCNGARTLLAIVNELAEHYSAPAEIIERDVLRLLEDLRLKRMVEL